MKLIFLLIYILVILTMSIISFILFMLDKNKAINNSERIKEKTLLGFVAYGGAIGGLLGSLLFRHKTNKIYFKIAIYLGMVLQLFALALLIVTL